MANPIPGYPGYEGWDPVSAAADFRATGGRGKEGGGGGGSSSNSSGFQQITPVDFAKLEEQAFEMLKPYYLKVAQAARGDFNRGVQILDEDYQKGTRVAKEDFERETGYTKEDLKADMAQLAVEFPIEQETLTDTLNRRGMAVGEMTAPDEYQVLTGGRGKVETDRLLEKQALRKEAVDRTANRRLEELGINFGRYTNPQGQSTANLGSVKDRTGLGAAELSYVRGREDLTRQQQLKEEQLAEARRKEALGIAGSLASVQAKEIPTALTNKYLQDAKTDFIEKAA